MSKQSAFDRELVEESAAVETTGLLEQLNLPPAAITYIRKNQRTIWAVAIGIALIVVGVSLYGSYTTYKEEKAASALSEAMMLEGEARQEKLAAVVADYGSTPSGLWGRIELAHMTAAEGDYGQAVAKMNEVKKTVSPDNPVMPLLVNNIAILHEKNGDVDKAVNSYNELLGFKGFEPGAYVAMGRLYELQGKNDMALQMYRKYMATGEEDVLKNPLAADPEREMIQARIVSLEK